MTLPPLILVVVRRPFGLQERGLVAPSLLSSPRLGLGRSLFSALLRGPRTPALNRSLGRLPVVAPLLPVGGGLGIGRELRSGASGRTPVRGAQLPWAP
jgi:hypothetical protein